MKWQGLEMVGRPNFFGEKGKDGQSDWNTYKKNGLIWKIRNVKYSPLNGSLNGDA
jgi:hypothetical protein